MFIVPYSVILILVFGVVKLFLIITKTGNKECIDNICWNLISWYGQFFGLTEPEKKKQ